MSMFDSRVLPKGENLRRAVRWIGERGDHRIEALTDAARRFDLSPADEEFLMSYFRNSEPRPKNSGGL